MCKALFLWMILFSVPCFLYSQEITDIEKLLQDNDVEGSEAYYEDIVTTLQYLATNPININSASFDSLKILFFLSDAQIDNILEFRKKHGAFMHPNELLLITGIGTRDLSNIKPFIRIGEYLPESARSFYTRHEILARMKTTRPKQAGYKKYSRDAFIYEKDYLSKKRNRFQGAPVSTLLKYKANIGTTWQGGITLGNDAGENYFTKNQKTGFDFLSVHLCFTPNKIIQKICIGDYKIQWGQGLIAWGGFSSGKSSASLSNEKSGNGIMPYFSTDENRFLRGGAISLQPLRDLTTDIFVSYKKTDGNLLDADTLVSEDIQTATLYTTGYHRNELELEKKHTLKEFTTGVSTRLNHQYFRAGIQILHYNFTPPLAIGKAAYQQYNDPGHHRTLVSVSYKTGFNHFFLFGETARSDNGSWATVNGLRYTGLRPVALCILYRRYDKDFRSYYNSSFSEYSNSSNEEGIYIGIESTPLRNLKLNAYYDHFRFFTPRYQATIPGSGDEIMGELTYSRSLWECNFRFKHEEKPEDYKAEKLTSVTRVKQEYRLQFSYLILACLKLQSRAIYSRYAKREKKESGFLVYQDFSYISRKENLKAQFRLSYFDTDSYNARIYAYEHNVLYGYSFPAYQDRGIRSYLNFNWKPYRNITLYLKTGFTYYPDKTVISSSLSQVDDNKLFDLTFQVRIKI